MPDWEMTTKTKLKDAWAAGNAAINGWLAVPSPVTAELTARADFDSVTVDLQHGLIDYQTALTMLQAMSASGVTPMARAPWLEPGLIMKLLDAGALGIVCPMINTPEDAENLVRYTRYAPRGVRSFGPTRAAITYGAQYWTTANESVVTLAMIETAEALDNLDAIVATPDLSGVYIGPSDLSLSLGRTPKLDHDDPVVLAAIERIREAAHRAGIKAGIHCLSPSYAKSMVDAGFDLVTVGSDLRIYVAALSDTVAAVRS